MLLHHLFFSQPTFNSISEEFAPSKTVHKVELSDDVNKAEDLAEKVAHGVHVVLLEVKQQVVDQNAFLDRTFFDRLQARVKA